MELFRLFGSVVLNGQSLINSQLSQIETKANSLGDRLNNVGASLTNAGTKMTMFVSMPIMKFLSDASKASIEFNQQITNTGAIANATEAEMKKLKEQAIDLGIKTKYSALEVAKGQEEMIKAGRNLNQVFSEMEHVLNLAGAGQIEVARAAEIVAISMNQFSEQGVTAKQVADQLAGAANSSATDVSALAFSLKYVAPVAGALKVPFNDLVATLAVMADNGARGTSAGTWLRQTLMRLTPASDAAAATMLRLGITTKDGGNAFFDATGKMKPMTEVIDILGKKTHGLTDQQLVQDLKTMFGMVASPAIINFVRKGGQAISDMADDIKKITAAEVAARKMDTLKGSIEILKSTWETFLIKIGDLQAPFVTKTVQFLNSIVTKLASLDDKILGAGIIILGIIAIIGPLIVILGTLISSIATIAGVISSVGLPVILLVAGLTALVAGIGYVIVKTGIWRDILTIIKPKFDALVDVVKFFINHLRSTGDILDTVYVTFIKFSGASDQTKVKFFNFIGVLMEVRKALQNVVTFFKNFFSALAEGETAIDSLRIALFSIVDVTKTNMKAIFAFTDGLEQLKNSVMKVFNSIYNLVIPILTDIATFLYPFFIKAKNEWLPPLMELASEVMKFASAIYDEISKKLDALKVIWDVIWPMLQLILTPILNNLISMVKWAINVIKDVIKIITGIIKGDWESVWEGIKGIFNSTWENIKSIAKNSINGLVELLSGIFPKARGYFTDMKNGIINIVGTLANDLYNSGGRMMDMFISGISNKIQQLKNTVGRVASTVKDFLGFQSPTKEGAGAESDKWMPNLMNMLTKGIEDKKAEFQNTLSGVIKTPTLNANIGMTGVGMNKFKQQQPTVIININDTKLFNTDDIDKIMNPIVSRLRSLNIQGRSF